MQSSAAARTTHLRATRAAAVAVDVRRNAASAASCDRPRRP